MYKVSIARGVALLSLALWPDQKANNKLQLLRFEQGGMYLYSLDPPLFKFEQYGSVSVDEGRLVLGGCG